MQGGIFLREILKNAAEKFKDKKLIAVVLIHIVFLSFFLFYNFKTGLFADDYGYMFTFSQEEKLINERIDSLGDVFRSQYAHYFIMNGRSVSHAMLQTVLMLGKTAFNFINTLFYFALCFGMYCIAKRRGKHEPLLQLLMYLIPWTVFTEFGRVFLISCMAVNYLWTMAIIILTILPFKRLYDGADPFAKHPWLGAAIMLPVGIISGWSSENGSAAMLFCIGCMGLYYLLARKRFPLWCVTGFAGMCAGFLMMLLAPGYDVRREATWGTDYAWQFRRITIYHILNHFELIMAAIFCLICICYFSMEKAKRKRIICVLLLGGGLVVSKIVSVLVHVDYKTECQLAAVFVYVVICIVAAIRAIRAKADISHCAAPAMLMFTGIVAMYTMIAVPLVEARSQTQLLVFFTCGAARVMVDFIRMFSKTVSFKRLTWLLTAAAMASAVASLSASAVNISSAYEQFEAREQYIEEQKAAGNYDIKLDFYDIPADTHVGMLNMYNNDPEYWTNKAICWYYGIDSVEFTSTSE